MRSIRRYINIIYPQSYQVTSIAPILLGIYYIQIDIKHISQKPPEVAADEVDVGIDLSDFYTNVEWDLMAVPANKTYFSYAGSDTQFIKWKFEVSLRRKFLFYTVNLMIPLISHAFITVLVFYIPAASTEKMALTINILLSLTVFFLMMAEIVPVTSLVVPLLGKYLLFTLMLVASSIIVTVITYQVHFRNSSTHSMPDWTRKVSPCNRMREVHVGLYSIQCSKMHFMRFGIWA